MTNLEFIERPTEPIASEQPFPWRTAGALYLACIVGTFAIMPFTYSLMLQMKFPGIKFELIPLLMAVSIVVDAIFGLVFSAVAIGLGLWLGARIGIGVPVLQGWGVAQENRPKLIPTIGLGILSGVILGGIVLMSAIFVGGEVAGRGSQIVLPSPWEGFLASIGAGIREEVWLRLGLMTFLTWLGTTVTRRTSPGTGLIWSANFMATLAFAAMHLPQAMQLIGLSIPVVLFVFLGNGVPGLVFGWLYWRKGLLAAIVSHFFLDIVLKVVVPLIQR